MNPGNFPLVLILSSIFLTNLPLELRIRSCITQLNLVLTLHTVKINSAGICQYSQLMHEVFLFSFSFFFFFISLPF